MVNEKMAIVAEPRKIIGNVIRSVSIFMMHRKYPLIICPTYFTHLGTSGSIEDRRIGGARMSAFPTFMLRAKKYLISPEGLATLVAKILFVFCDPQETRFPVEFFPACPAMNKLTRPHGLVVACT